MRPILEAPTRTPSVLRTLLFGMLVTGLVVHCGADSTRRTVEHLCPEEPSACDAGPDATSASGSSGPNPLQADGATRSRDAAPGIPTEPGDGGSALADSIAPVAVSDGATPPGPSPVDASASLDSGLPISPEPPDGSFDGAALLDGALSLDGGFDAAGVGVACENPEDCTFGNLCLLGVCSGGYCLGAVPRPEIDDGNPCTRDRCQPATGGVTHEPQHSLCQYLDLPPECDDSGSLVQTRGVCDPSLGCVAEQVVTEECSSESTFACVDGTLTESAGVCRAGGEGGEASCGTGRSSESCPTDPPRCTGDGESLSHVTYTASCSDPSQCSETGTPSPTSCGARSPECQNDSDFVTFEATCEPATGCADAEASRETCSERDLNTCVDGGHLVSACQCDAADGCVCEGGFTQCQAPPPRCEDGEGGESYVVDQATCSTEDGCGSEELSREYCDEGNLRYCEGNLHVTRACLCDPLVGCDCADQTTQCTAQDPTCVGGRVTTYFPTCSASDGCSTEMETEDCGVSPSFCQQTPNGLVHTRFVPACSGGSSCADGGSPLVTPCMPRPPLCEGPRFTSFRPECSGAGGCFHSVAVQLDCRDNERTRCVGDGDLLEQTRCQCNPDPRQPCICTTTTTSCPDQAPDNVCTSADQLRVFFGLCNGQTGACEIIERTQNCSQGCVVTPNGDDFCRVLTTLPPPDGPPPVLGQ